MILSQLEKVREVEKRVGGGNSGFFLLKLEERLHSFPQVPWIENAAFCAVPRNVAFAMNTALLIAPTRTTLQMQQKQPESVSLVNKQREAAGSLHRASKLQSG